jgi:hypothetical protein
LDTLIVTFSRWDLLVMGRQKGKMSEFEVNFFL